MWQEIVGNDKNSLVRSDLPHNLTPGQIRQKLAEIWQEDLPSLDEGYGEIKPHSVEELFILLKLIG